MATASTVARVQQTSGGSSPHGKGSLKAQQDDALSGLRISPTKKASPIRVDQRRQKVTVIPFEEWQRIRGSLSKTDKQHEQRKARVEEKKALHDTSKAIVKNWENTIEGQRQKRLQARRIREEAEEEEKVKIDIEEAKYQAERRKEDIEKAKTLLYYQTDRLKTFHTALRLTEVLRERDAQLEFKKKKASMYKNLDEQYVKMQHEEREKAILADIEKAKERAKASEKVKRYQILQIAKNTKEKQVAREEALAEQSKLEQESRDFHAKERELATERKRMTISYRKDLDSIIEDRREEGERDMADDRAEDEDRKMFNDAKRKLLKMRVEKERDIQQEVQRHQEHMCTLLRGQVQQKTSDEDEKIARAIAEQDAKKQKEEREKQQKLQGEVKEIYKHRYEMILEKQRKEEQERELDRELLQQRISQDERYQAQKMERMNKALQEACRVQESYREKMEERKNEGLAVLKQDKEAVTNGSKLLGVEEEQFQEYTRQVLEEAKGRGANLLPLKVAAKPGAGGGHGPQFLGKGGIRPSYLTTDEYGMELPSFHPRDTSQRPIQFSTHKRLGCTW